MKKINLTVETVPETVPKIIVEILETLTKSISLTHTYKWPFTFLAWYMQFSNKNAWLN